MKNKLAYFYVLLFLAFSCTNKERLTELEIYTFLEICYEDYYFNYDLEITPLLEDFEQQLIKEGHLKDSTGIAYKELLKKLESETFFSLPLNKEGFNEVALYNRLCIQYFFDRFSFGVKHTILTSQPPNQSKN